MEITETKLRKIIREEVLNEMRKYQKHIGKTIRDISVERGSARDSYEYLVIEFEDGTKMNISGKEITA